MKNHRKNEFEYQTSIFLSIKTYLLVTSDSEKT